MADQSSAPDRAADLQSLTRDYARFSRSAGGLAAVAGGVLCLVSYLLGGLLPSGPVLHGVLAAMPLFWLVGKQWFASSYYQRFGHAEELETARERNTRRVFLGLTVVACFAVGAGLIGRMQPLGDASWSLGQAAYLLVVLTLPWIVWRWLRSPLEFVVGVLLLCQAALALRGSSYALWSSAAVFPLAAAMMIGAGVRDHRAFLRIERSIRQLIQSQQASG